MIAKMRNKRGISPVIATVILVAVAITVAVAVAYWMSGIAAQYTAFEKIEIQTAICTWDDGTGTPASGSTGQWVIEIKLKNSGTATATLTNLFVNDVEVDGYTIDTTTPLLKAGDNEAATDMTQTETIESGADVTVNVFIDGLGGGTPADTTHWKSVSSGTTINIKIHSANGMDYIKLVKLT